MAKEALMIAVDNSDFMRNGDFAPTRLQAQHDAVNFLCHVKRNANPENTVGLISLTNTEVLCTLTSDVNKLINRLHAVQLKGDIRFCTSIKIAHLALRHRQFRQQKMRIICFIGSPIKDDEADMVKLARRLKKEKVSVDIVNFGEDEVNQKKLLDFVEAVNGKDGTGSHLVSVPPGTGLRESLHSSPIVGGEDGAGAIGLSGFDAEFGMDAIDDPDLLYALRVSMEEHHQAQERQATAESSTQPSTVLPQAAGTSEEDLLRQALALSVQDVGGPSENTIESNEVDVANMTEDQQIAYAIHMSMQTHKSEVAPAVKPEPETVESFALLIKPLKFLQQKDNGGVQSMEVDDVPPASTSVQHEQTPKSSSVECDPEFLQSVLQYLPGVDPQNEEVRQAIESLTSGSGSKDKQEEEKKMDDDEIDK
ncbi:unnamed protein product [Rodentolepis nana]|uniref:26S proteasome non-ATPase regulatory subunit 4 n=1 Tax=Rodentolepis nana TaxID=102285 RepID=A0A0R3TJY6_RODNA|nr:unnamed protein product [Rodentolepis nana]